MTGKNKALGNPIAKRGASVPQPAEVATELVQKPAKGRGGPGRGGGRKLESGAKAVAKNVSFDPEDIEFLVSQGVGDGELSRGVRLATQALRQKLGGAAKKALA